MCKKLLLLAIALLHLHIYAQSMLVNPQDPLSDKSTVINELFNTVVQTVKKHPHRINEFNEDGYTLLQLALINNSYIDKQISLMQHKNGVEQDILEISVTTIKMLLNNGADPNIPFPEEKSHKKGKQHFLIKATQSYVWPYFPLYIVKILFEHGLDDQIRGANGNTTLMRLIALKHVWRKISEYRKNFIKIVINNTSDFNIQNNQGNTALHFTSRFNDLETARLIMQNPIRLDMRNAQGKTPLQVAKSSAGMFPPDESNLKWYWYFSFFSTSYKMVKFLQEAEAKRPLTNHLPQLTEAPASSIHSTCKENFNGSQRSH